MNKDEHNMLLFQLRDLTMFHVIAFKTDNHILDEQLKLYR
jgi:hypothetical protein